MSLLWLCHIRSRDVSLMLLCFYVGDFEFVGGPGAHFGIFLGPVLSRGNDQQVKEFYNRGLRMELIGCYAQTELGL